ncbi:MAG: calcium/sodium antiporter [Desulfobacteraceae bacterium]|nr:calcium/sodium antiporter [Desulfobacteraceae bacterium]MCF8093917.1 calcium/sodium antiporter [Desulfobacteraceae bacterium]
MDSFLPYLLLIIGLVLLVKGADLLVEGAGSIARRLKISDLVIGLTIVSFGTSAPELFVNVTASINGNTGIAIGNVLGSNIANILLILGISAVIYPLGVSRGTVWREIPFSLLAAVVLGIAANDRFFDGWIYSDISRSDGLIFLMFFAIFLYYSASISRNFAGDAQGMPMQQRRVPASLAMVAGGLVGLSAGGKLIVDGAIHIAVSMGMSEAVVGLTIVAVGTSLPELATSAMAAWRKNVEIAVGNVVGSNIFNIFFVLGVSSVIKPIPFHTGANLDIAMVILAGLILFVTMFTGKRRSLDRWEGALLMLLYAAYLGYLLLRG